MKEEVARSVIRLMALATTFVGIILTIQAIIGSMAIRNALGAQASSIAGNLGGYGVFAHAITIATGLVLFAASPGLAKKITE